MEASIEEEDEEDVDRDHFFAQINSKISLN
jgi:hypothetical protein